MPKGVYIRTEEHKRKISEGHEGVLHTEKAKRKMSERHKGMLHTEKTKHKMNKTHRGMNHSEETKRKISETHKGMLHTEKTKSKISKAFKGKSLSKEHRYKISKALTGKPRSEETKHKIRIAAMNRMIDNKMFPTFNKLSIQFFDILNKVIFNNDGQYGVNEFCIFALGYWLDFISHKYKTIIEWDEEYHNRQIEKDTIRQAKIQAHYSDYIFIRIKENDIKINILANIFANKIK